MGDIHRGPRDLVICRRKHFIDMVDIHGSMSCLGIGVRYLFSGMRSIISVSDVSMGDIHRGLRDLVICRRKLFIDIVDIPGCMRRLGIAEVSKILEC